MVHLFLAKFSTAYLTACSIDLSSRNTHLTHKVLHDHRVRQHAFNKAASHDLLIGKRCDCDTVRHVPYRGTSLNMLTSDQISHIERPITILPYDRPQLNNVLNLLRWEIMV
jgi:hypothetical protein